MIVLLIYWYAPDSYRYPPLVEAGSWLWSLLLINLVFLGLRLLQRFYFVTRLHVVIQGLLSIPRTFWANAINFAASFRALRLYLGHLLTGKPLGWDKTQHEFPALAKGRPNSAPWIADTSLAQVSIRLLALLSRQSSQPNVSTHLQHARRTVAQHLLPRSCLCSPLALSR